MTVRSGTKVTDAVEFRRLIEHKTSSKPEPEDRKLPRGRSFHKQEKHIKKMEGIN